MGCSAHNLQPRQKNYWPLATKNGWPAYSTLGATGRKWEEWIKLADEWRAAKAKAA